MSGGTPGKKSTSVEVRTSDGHAMKAITAAVRNNQVMQLSRRKNHMRFSLVVRSCMVREWMSSSVPLIPIPTLALGQLCKPVNFILERHTPLSTKGLCFIKTTVEIG